MSAVPAPKSPNGTPAALDRLFDFEAAHARTTARLRKALDGNGAAGSDLEPVSHSERMHGIVVAAHVKTKWTGNEQDFAGPAQGNIKYVHAADLAAAATRSFNEFSARAEHVDKVVVDLTSSPAKGFGSSGNVDLGRIPLSFASQRNCRGCGGDGQCRCPNLYCSFGKVTCSSCNGTQRYGYGKDSVPCYQCLYGKMNCRTCMGTTWVGCGPCNRTGIFTTLWTASVVAEVEYRIHTPEGHDKAWTESLTKSGHSWLAGEGFVGKPQVSRTAAGAGIGWTVDVPVMAQTFRIGDRQYTAGYVGRRERMWSLPRFIDDTLKPIGRRIAAARSAEAFTLAAQYPIFSKVRDGVLHSKCEDAAVAGMFEKAVSTEVVEEVRLRLEAGRDQIARSTISTVWKYAAVALTAGSLIALASGRTRAMIGAVLPELQRVGTNGEVAFIGGLMLTALLGATWLLAGFAGRSAVGTVLQTKVERLPEQGRAPVYACIAAFLAYGAGAYLLAPKAEASPTRTAAIPALPGMPSIKPPTIPPFYLRP